ncbi:hypothetical protein Gpo141_00007186 [Globisporangium polare]
MNKQSAVRTLSGSSSIGDALGRRDSSGSTSGGRRPPPAVKWNWLHATACSSAIVASFAYVQNEANRYFAASAAVNDDGRPRDAFLSTDIAMSQTFSTATVIHTTTMSTYVRYALVTVIMGAWFVALIVSRQYRLHFPLKRIGRRVVGIVEKIQALHERHQTKSQQRKRSRAQQRRHSWGYFGIDRELDELDMLVVTSLSPERNELPYASAKPVRRDSTQTESGAPATVSRTSTGKQIVLNPRVGARGGRHQSNQIVSDDPFVSRYHFQIQYDPMEKEYFLQDLGSTTGTFVFLKPHIPKRLHINDRVKLGDTEFEVVAIDENLATGTPFLRICFTEGPLTGIGQTVGRTAVTLGRRSSNALCITDDGSISGRHSVISYLGDGFYITDLNSTNGTAVRLSASGEKSQRRYLLHGDVFGVGSNRFLIEYSHQLDAHRGHQPRQQGIYHNE